MAAATHEEDLGRLSGDGSLAWLGLLLFGLSSLLSVSSGVWLVRLMGRLLIQ